jgi:hypothetical protein
VSEYYTLSNRRGNQVPASIVPIAVAAHLAFVDPIRIEKWVASGELYSEKIRGKLYTDLEAVLKLATDLKARTEATVGRATWLVPPDRAVAAGDAALEKEVVAAIGTLDQAILKRSRS